MFNVDVTLNTKRKKVRDIKTLAKTVRYSIQTDNRPITHELVLDGAGETRLIKVGYSFIVEVNMLTYRCNASSVEDRYLNS